MCTRYYTDMSPELRPFIETALNSSLKEKMISVLGKEFKFSGEIRPTDMTTVISPDRSGNISAFPMVWGYHINGIERPVINVRSESAKYKQSFAADWRSHRCIIPALYYFEWEHIRTADGHERTGDKFAIQPEGCSFTWIAGLYRLETYRGLTYPVFTVLTRTPGESVRRIHDRMPLILPGSAVKDWIRPGSDPDAIAQLSLTDMVLEKY